MGVHSGCTYRYIISSAAVLAVIASILGMVVLIYTGSLLYLLWLFIGPLLALYAVYLRYGPYNASMFKLWANKV